MCGFSAKLKIKVKIDLRPGLEMRLLPCSLEVMQCDLECPCKAYDPMQSQVIPDEVLPPSGQKMHLKSQRFISSGGFTVTAQKGVDF